MAPVIEAVHAAHDMQGIVVSTGQHREMLDQVIDVFGIDVDIDLHVMREDQSLAELTSRLLSGIDGVLDQLRPDMTLVQGDTTTTFVADASPYCCWSCHGKDASGP